jgi:diaminohydroxyphosphoribosylaminopyrimidine deaminase/5-amino-6-(5-phosphoribosylamino)uracil reductase
MLQHEIFMKRCIELAYMGLGHTYPNPVVGSVIVYENKIIGEGYHTKAGESHAEVNAIKSVKNKKLLEKSTIYVNLEPCSHFGKTPPCADLIIENKINEVVVGSIDPFENVSGKGIEKLKNAGCKVTTGVLENECNELNKRFFTFHSKKRPYVILKWAQTIDGFIDIVRNSETPIHPYWITNQISRILVHKWRSEEQAIIVGTNTVLKDNPQLTVRDWIGDNPLRIVIDEKLILNSSVKLFDNISKTLVFNRLKNEILLKPSIEYIKLDFEKDIITQILNVLFKKGIQSLIVEGGTFLINSFYNNNLWDEARIFIGNKTFQAGISAPLIKGNQFFFKEFSNNHLYIYKNGI